VRKCPCCFDGFYPDFGYSPANDLGSPGGPLFAIEITPLSRDFDSQALSKAIPFDASPLRQTVPSSIT
jgi:hypothetical protein